ncbi:hypothetical protein OGAPHI_003773 [Ogataea philodendri]|uniref:Uncharacterized protein n=1 Tax=Ogataea philodendri TaxID=1378263 RepID=A0A9P8T564_9ASCO|nr:uncharacterized protein OGAPHI_003773 [Ogataea philodendri]KAH3665586.1 hypothetical protein OGAPHI_003773 [Ogataea philodendri]
MGNGLVCWKNGSASDWSPGVKIGALSGSKGRPEEAGTAVAEEGEKAGMSLNLEERSANLETMEPVGVNEGVSKLNFLRAPVSAVSECEANGDELGTGVFTWPLLVLIIGTLSAENVVDADVGSETGVVSELGFLEGSSWLKEQPFFSHLQYP